MANIDTIKGAVANQGIVKQDSLKVILDNSSVKARFQEVLGKKSAGFISSILSAVNASKNLQTVEPKSIVSAAMMAATLDLPINSNLGFAHIVPYGNVAQFQMGWKGFVQLAIRTGQYRTMNAAEIYEGELIHWNRVTGIIDVDTSAKKSDTVIGYVAFFRLNNGFEKYIYMTTEEVKKHAKQYSKSYSNPKGQWVLNFNAMALKTVIKMLLSKYGILSIEMQQAIQSDQGVIETTSAGELKVEYKDAYEVGEDNTEPIEIEGPVNAQ